MSRLSRLGLAVGEGEPASVDWVRSHFPGQGRRHGRHAVTTGIAEIDRVLGGGFVPGAVVLLGGEPGVGKSTLVLQTAGALAAGGSKVLIASAEESAEQVGLRAERLELTEDEVYLLAEADIDDILGASDRLHPDLLVVDSVQTVMAAEIGSAPGSVSQVRESRGPGYAARQGFRHRCRAGRTCDEGWGNRRTQNAGAHG